MSRARRRIVAAIVAAGAVLTPPATAFADAARPSDWRSEIVAIRPETTIARASIVGSDAFLRLVVEPGHEAIVFGYGGEPYLRFEADGTVSENLRSPSTYINRTMDGLTEPPPDADPTAAPEWSPVGSGGAWSWHDHRAHYMGGDPPADMQPGEAIPDTIVPLTVDGTETEIVVRTTLLEAPSPWPTLLGGLLGVALVAATAVGRRRLPVAAAILPVAGAATLLGLVQYRDLPSETAPPLVWWLPAVVALACGAATLFAKRMSLWVRSAVVLIAAVQLLIWGWSRRDGLSHAAIPTPAPFWLDRAVTAASITAGCALIVAVVVELVSEMRQVSGPTAPSVTPNPARR